MLRPGWGELAEAGNLMFHLFSRSLPQRFCARLRVVAWEGQDRLQPSAQLALPVRLLPVCPASTPGLAFLCP